MRKNMTLIFHRNMLYSGGRSTLHRLTRIHSQRFFQTLEKITKKRSLRQIPKPDDNFFTGDTYFESCPLYQKK